MSYIKDFRDRLFLGRIGFYPEQLSEASENAASLAVEPDGTLVLGEGGGGEPITVTWDDVEDKPDFGTASEADVEDFATSAQGELADSAVQPADVAALVTSYLEGLAGYDAGEDQTLQNLGGTLTWVNNE